MVCERLASPWVERGMVGTECLIQAVLGKGSPVVTLEEPISYEIHKSKEANRRKKEF